MKKAGILPLLMISVLLWSAAGSDSIAVAAAQTPPVSGSVVNGFRLLPVAPSADELHLTVYRGDYVKFALGPDLPSPVLRIPELGIASPLKADLQTTPYFKMKRSGRFAFSINETRGVIEVVAYRQDGYRELTAAEAADLIRSSDPLILDVRTRGEHQRGRLANSILIPVQELQRRVGELAAYKEREILVYCATGNRSTVASKVLMDQGFGRISNLRRGIADWWRKKYPIVQ